MRRSALIVQLCFQLFSLGIAGLVLLSIAALYAGALELFHIAPVVLTLGAAVAFRYTAMYHQFTRTWLRYVFTVVTGLVALLAVAGTGFLIAENLVVEEIRTALDATPNQLQDGEFLLEWWYIILLVPPSLLIIFGAVLPREYRPYPRPTRFRAVATSPAYLGFVSAFFGLWAVLFVGIGLQRVLVVAPIFEELLKFGVALLVSAVLFDRSMAARIGVALVVGSLFGVIEHATTYPDESDVIYLYRTLFHSVTPAVSVGVYTMFEESDMNRMLWVAPVFPMMFHFFYNTFAVLSSIVMSVIVGSQVQLVVVVYGAATVLICFSILLLAVARHRTITMMHKPVYEVLSNVT